MSSLTPDWTAVVERLEKLERQNRRLKQAGAVALIIAAAVLLMGQVSQNRTVEANEFVLKNSNGDVRGRWFMLDDDWPQLRLFDGNGKRRVSLDVIPFGPQLIFHDQNEVARITLDSMDGRDETFLSSGLIILDPVGNTEASLLVLNRLSVVGDYTSRPELALIGGVFRNAQASLAVVENGSSLSRSDVEGFKAQIGTTGLVTPRTGETHKTSAASVVLFDKDQKVLWKAP